MNKTKKVALAVTGALLVINGLLNICDDARVLTYDITSILAGIGFVITSRLRDNTPSEKE